MIVRKIGAVIALSSLLATGASAKELDDTTAKVLEVAAIFTEFGVACGDMSESDAKAGKAKQREAMLAQGIDARSYDKAYDAAGADFRKKWAAMSSADQKKSCADMKKRSQEAAAQGKFK